MSTAFAREIDLLPTRTVTWLADHPHAREVAPCT